MCYRQGGSKAAVDSFKASEEPKLIYGGRLAVSARHSRPNDIQANIHQCLDWAPILLLKRPPPLLGRISVFIWLGVQMQSSCFSCCSGLQCMSQELLHFTPSVLHGGFRVHRLSVMWNELWSRQFLDTDSIFLLYFLLSLAHLTDAD